MAKILILGTGDVGSAVAHHLFSAGHIVLLHDTPCPAHVRRAMAFTDALFDGYADLDSVVAKRVRAAENLPIMLRCRRAIPVSTDAIDELVCNVVPDILIDARMRKRVVPESRRGFVPLTIGLGPNFEAGGNVDWAVETAWEDGLGQILRAGKTRPLAGEPRALAGIGRERFVYSPITGTFLTSHAIAGSVAAGEVIGNIGGWRAVAPFAGHIRGLSHNGAHVEIGMKVLEVDPRPMPAVYRGLGERPRRIADSVSTAIALQFSLEQPRLR